MLKLLHTLQKSAAALGLMPLLVVLCALEAVLPILTLAREFVEAAADHLYYFLAE